MRTITAGRSGFSGERFRQSGTGFLALVSLAAILLALPGCSGCNKDPAALKAELEKAEAEKKKKEAEKPKDDFDRGNLGTYPTPNRPLSNSCKQGHWTSAVLVDMKANNFDFHGDMDLEMLDGQSHPQPLLATPFELSTSRQISFPKGQAKRFDSVFFVPQNAEKTTAQCKISARGGGRTVAEIPMLLARMPSYQYHLVVLSRIPEQYGYLNKPEARFFSVTPYVKDIDNNLEPYYRVTYLSGEKQPALPKHASLWTSIACIVWDDALPSTFDLDQQRALIDWLHWGGQIVMSGPDTLDSLKGSFLEPYLPATAAGSRDIAAEDLAEINAFSGKDIRKIVPVKSWSGVKFDKHPQAEYVPRSGDLVVERRVGRGRIVVTAFRLGDRGFKTWPGADEFFSAYLLRHPPRKFREGDEMDDVKALWSDDKKHKDFDAAEITGLRYFARDAEIKLAEYAPDLPKLEEPAREALGFGYGYGRMNPNSVPDESDAIDLTNSGTVRGPGVAAWNDFSPAAGRARDALLSAARIEVPKRMFVVTVLVLYLAFLVPFNYCLFRAMNRVEWAWAAAPVIAIICTAAVIRLAQLDIGFIRSRTEIGVLEIQSDYSRSHLTRYNALYTSLTTPYDFTFADGGAVALPFPKVKEPNLFALVTGEERRNLRYVSGDQAMLQGVPVRSNSTTLMHSEEVFELGGPLALKRDERGGFKLDNRTNLKLQGVGLIEKQLSGNLQAAWIGSLDPGAEKSVVWLRESGTGVEGRLWDEYREKIPLSKSSAKLGDLNLREMLNFAERTDEMRPGDVKLIGWIDENLPGLTISPVSAQARHAVLVVAHLAYGKPPDPQPDQNIPRQPLPSKRDIEYNEEE